MGFEELDIKGCFLVHTKPFSDARGSFVKVYNDEAYKELGFIMEFKEEYYSVSRKGVVRGMHFQLPPYDHEKFVYCPKGRVFDVFLDLRKSSETFLKHGIVELNNINCSALILPKGIAHGFCALEDRSIMVYKTSTVYRQEWDNGILWNSCGIRWPEMHNPEFISQRDRSFEKLSDFYSPFI
ncbi:MAG: dTDP-4-dehydrorhamnose 3,5-epimerase [Gammaproteobacteria bacterium]|nr:dTDP-4-dehydrorhamnose 3,5-epimerase [Gammaproteobacteria bacterium]MDH5801216.1 dTDP-4-dehydrorhamnose 3,5-epimerase [Gammaproteobacteria bacterium]